MNHHQQQQRSRLQARRAVGMTGALTTHMRHFVGTVESNAAA
ncbi:MAG: hypothetical protein OSA97_00265 [Nevskia sp.]|nr:hypothetical protein [Nevskia sp.]